MEILVANAGPARRVTDKNGTWLVAPLKLIVPGVLDGSRGPLYYPADEIAKNYTAWDGQPLTKNHPTRNGNPASARDKGVIESVGLGVVRNPSIINTELHAEGWFHEERVKRVDKEIWNALVEGRPIELSTGLGTLNEDAEGKCPTTGREYKGIARNYEPDHVAILTDGQKGACSIDDGCGVNNSKGIVETFWDWLTNAGRFGNPQSKNTGQFKRTGAGTGKGDVHDAAMGGHLTFGERDRELGKMAAMEKETLGNNPASWVADEGTWEKAKEAAAKTYDEGEEAYWPAVAAIYQRMGGEIVTHNSNEDPDMTRDQAITKLVANCSCWKGKKELLSNNTNFTDEEIMALLNNAESAAALASIGKSVGAPATITANAMPAFIQEKIDKKKEAEEEETANADPDAEEEETVAEDEGEKKKPAFLNKTKNSRRKPKTVQSWLEEAPPEARDMLGGLIENDKSDRKDSIEKLVANAAAEDQAELRTEYGKMATKTLKKLVGKIPTTNRSTEENDLASYFGLQGGGMPVSNANTPDSVEYAGEWPPSLPLKTTKTA